MERSERKRANLTLNEEEFARVSEEASLLSQTVAERIKEGYFKKEQVRPVMSRDDALRVLKELSRIGTNVNQIAKKVNSGFREGFNPAFEEVKESLGFMRNFIKGFDGVRQN